MRGFTLIDSLFYVAGSAIILFSLGAFLVSTLEGREQYETILEVEAQATYVYETLMRTIEEANGVTVPSYGASGSSLTLGIRDAASDPTIIALSGTTLQMTKGAGAAVDMTSSRVEVSSVTFEHLGNGVDPATVRFTFTIAHVNPGSREIFDYSRTVSGTATLRYDE